MTTVVNNPAPQNDSNGVGMMVGLVVLVAGVYLFFVYGLPAMQHLQVGAPQITVPSTIDVNVKQTN